MDCTDIRSIAISILSNTIPKSIGDNWFDTILCQNRILNPEYHPGPDICHWLLWKLGCRDSRIICRDIPEYNIKHGGNAISKIVTGAQRISAWKRFTFENSPLPGDILHLGSNIQREPEHICIFLRSEGNNMITADIIMSEKTIRWILQEVTRKLDGFKTIDKNGIIKQLNGWVDICSIIYDVPPDYL